LLITFFKLINFAYKKAVYLNIIKNKKTMRTFKKYKENLQIVHEAGADFIKSYSTLVAKIDYDKRTAIVSKWYSMTTSKHINYACQELGLTIVNSLNN